MGEKSLDIYKDVISNIYTSHIYNGYDYLIHITRDFSPILFLFVLCIYIYIIYMYIYLSITYLFPIMVAHTAR